MKSIAPVIAFGAAFSMAALALAALPAPAEMRPSQAQAAIRAATTLKFAGHDPYVQVPGDIYRAGGGPFPFANPFSGLGRFELLWSRVDKPVREGKVRRSWFWGPGPTTPGLLEPYKEDPLGRGMRLVQYFDKSRMEMNDPYADENKVGYTTNGLLTVELISGYIQTGEQEFVRYRSACIPMSGDPTSPDTPTYAAFQGVSNSQAGDHRAPNLAGHRVTATIDRDGKTGNDPSKATVRGTDIVQYEAETGHNIPAAFYDFITAEGPVYPMVYNDGRYMNDKDLSDERLAWNLATGLPISEAYWSKATIRGNLTDVMIQAFERWVLTYVPTNPPGLQVEVGNIGQHYFEWRYRNGGLCAGETPGTPAPIVPAPTSTIAPMTPSPSVPTYAPPPPTGSITPYPTLPVPTGTATPLPTNSPSP